MVRPIFLAFLVILPAPVQGQSVHELFGTDQFHRAYIEASDVTFEPFQELAWEAQARAALPWLNLDRPTPPQIARLASTSRERGAAVPFRRFPRVPHSCCPARAAYLLISADRRHRDHPYPAKGHRNL